ncbi:transcriptional regulator [Helicobacter anseris]|uniref:Transcriptional regulator n=1 Tax=Helicobacter anseris TaxID=375926 RepID=A0A3D8J7V7_9HELI|nr:helix-turn-helix domain-containing protein [Helicobacter anseris]RDU73577.1 transcriptional regulator [Helicobacter anseris]
MKNLKCDFKNCGFNYTLSLISGKYKMNILYCLYKEEIIRYNKLHKILSPISFKTLTNTLKELETDKLILRKEYSQIPPKVEYSLSPRGKTLIPILNALCHWGEENKL